MGGEQRPHSVGNAAGHPQRESRAGSFVVGEEAPGLHGPASSWSMN